MPSTSQSSPFPTEPRRSASASTITRVWGRAPPPAPEPARSSRNASSRCASRGSRCPAAFQRRRASASRRGAIRAQATSSQRNAPAMPPSGRWCQRTCRHCWTRARRACSLCRLRAAARRRAAASLSSWCDAPLPASSSSVPAEPSATAAVSLISLSWGAERSASWSAPLRAGSAAARPAAARRALATAAEEPETAPSQSAADPWPALAYEPVSRTTGENSAMPDAAARSACAKSATTRRAWSPEADVGAAPCTRRCRVRTACSNSCSKSRAGRDETTWET